MSTATETTIESLMHQLIDETPVEELKAIAMDNLETNLAGMSSDEQLDNLTDQLKAAKARRKAAQTSAH